MSLKSLALERCPALLLFSPAFAHGNATVVSARVRLHTGQGRRMRIVQCGPDFLHARGHRRVSGAPVPPLHAWPASGPASMVALFGGDTL